MYELQYTRFLVNCLAWEHTVPMTKPTYQDATLLVHLAQWQTASDLPGALCWLWSDRFVPEFDGFARRYPPDSEGDHRAATICGYFEAVGALYKHGLINGDLLFDWLEVAPVWDRIRGYVLGRRKESGGAPLWVNFEALATAHKRQTREYST